MRHKVRHTYIIHLQELPQAVAFMENRKQRGSHQGQGSGWRGKQEPASEGPGAAGAREASSLSPHRKTGTVQTHSSTALGPLTGPVSTQVPTGCLSNAEPTSRRAPLAPHPSDLHKS